MDSSISSWKKITFDQIAEQITVRIDKPSESGLEDYIGLEHIDGDEIRLKRTGSTEDVNATKFICKKGDIIFGKRRAYLRKCAISDRKAVVSAHSMVLRYHGELIKENFLPWFMQSSTFWKTAHAISEGSLSPTIKWKTLAKQSFFIPTLMEQEQIANILWSIEDHIEVIEKLINKTKRVKKAMLNELLIKGIGHTRFQETELGPIPNTWKIVKVGDIFNLGRGRVLSKKYLSEHSGEYPVYSSQTSNNGCIGYIDSFDFEGEYITWTTDGAYAGTVYCRNGQFNCTNVCGTAKNKVPLSFKYFVYFLNTVSKQYVNYAGNPKLMNNTFSSILVPFPPIDEQEQISQKLNTFDNQLNIQKAHYENLQLLRKKLTNDLISGRIQIGVENV